MGKTARRPRYLAVALVAVSAWLMGPHAAQGADSTIVKVTFNNVSASSALNATPTSSTDVDDVTVTPADNLYLPASANLTGLSGWLTLGDGSTRTFSPTDYSVTPVSDRQSNLTFTVGGTTTVRAFQSSKVPAMFIKTVKGLPWIEASKDNADVNGAMAMVGPSASTAPTYNGVLAEMKGRGNSTWNYIKKPYQLKLGTNTELVAGAGSAKTWILLANYLDASLVRNELSYNFEGALLKRSGLNDYSIKGRMLDLWVDGGFRGSYFLTEKVQVGPTRVNITDLEKANAAANPGIDIGGITPTKASLSDPRFAGLTEAQYVSFPTVPTTYKTGGYLLEMDFASGSREEKSYFITRRGTPFTVKSPEAAHPDEVAYVARYMQNLEDAIFSDGTAYTNYINVQSWADYYAMQELLANDDAFKSSTYMYMDGGGKLFAGPLWDCDRALGSRTNAAPPASLQVGSIARPKPQWIKQLLAHPDFRVAVQNAYRNILTPEVNTVLASGGLLQSYAAEVADSAKLNKLRWPTYDSLTIWSATPAGDIATLRSYLTQRHAGMAKLFGNAGFLKQARLADGVYTIANGKLNVDVAGASTAVTANVQLWTPNTTKAQKFSLKRGTDSFYTITNVNSGQVLDVAGGVAANGTNVRQYPSNGSRAQKWQVGTYDGVNFTIASPLGSAVPADTWGPQYAYVLDAAAGGTTPGTNIRIWQSNGSPAQMFGFAPALVDNRAYRLVSKLNQNKVLDVAAGSTAYGANIQLWDSNGTAAQRYTLRQLAGDTYQVLTGTAPGRAVDVARAGTAPGTNVWQWQTNTTLAQQWSIRPTGDGDGSYYLVSRVSGLYLDVARAGTANGTNVWTWTGNRTTAQKFFIR